MISEVWNAKFNVQKIYESILKAQNNREAREFYPGYQGWSVLSEDGSVYSGWNEEAVVMNDKGEMDLQKSYEKKISLGLTKDAVHNTPTEFMTPELNDVYDIIKSKNLNPCRMRISILKAGSELYWHSDAPPDVYSVRLHIPLYTNAESYFETENEREHLFANGNAYFLKVNRRHRVVNYGNTDRWHLIMDVSDNSGFTKFHSLLNK